MKNGLKEIVTIIMMFNDVSKQYIVNLNKYLYFYPKLRNDWDIKEQIHMMIGLIEIAKRVKMFWKERKKKMKKKYYLIN